MASMASRALAAIACAGAQLAAALRTPEKIHSAQVRSASCLAITDKEACLDSEALHGISCAGWGGSVCIAHGAPAHHITDPDICEESYKRLGIRSLGWGGSYCLPEGARCSDITWPGICDSAAKKVGLTCAGWGGEECLEPGAPAYLITDKFVCEHSWERLNIPSAGWDGKKCAVQNLQLSTALKHRAVFLEYKVLQQEEGSTGSFSLSRGCSVKEDGWHVCPITMYDEEDFGTLEFDLANDVDERSSVVLNMNVSLHTIHLSVPISNVNTTCPACGRCGIELFGAKADFSDFSCPLLNGHHKRTRPAYSLGVPLLSHLTKIPTVNMFKAWGTWKMVRPSGAVVFEIGFLLKG